MLSLYNIIANCGHPQLTLPTCTMSCSADSVPQVVDYGSIVPVDGSTVSFSCPPGFLLTGSSSATCTANGEWEPDTRDLMCNESKGFSLHYSIEICIHVYTIIGKLAKKVYV